MDDIFIPVSFTKGIRAPLIQKVIDDAKKMMAMSKYVIILDSCGNIISSPTLGSNRKDSKLECLVVVAPLVYRDTRIEHAIVLEIGFNRFVPYAQAEYKTMSKDSIVITKAVKSRRVVANLSSDSLLHLLPHLFDVVQMDIDRRMMCWKKPMLSQIRGSKKYPREVPELLYIRIPENAPLLWYGAMLYDSKWREAQGGNLWVRARQLREWLQEFMKLRANHITEEGSFLDATIKKSGSMTSLSERLKISQNRNGYTSNRMQALERLIDSDPTSSLRRLLAQVRTIHKVPEPKEDVIFKKLEQTFGGFKEKLARVWKLHTVVQVLRNNKRKFHAKTCLAIGVAAREELRKNNSTKWLCEGSDDDIPF